MKRNQSIQDILAPLTEIQTQAYLSNAVQLADILEWILEQVGVSRVWQTSFSISEEFLRRLYFIEKSGKIKEFTLILDHKATNKTLKLWVFIEKVIKQTYLADNHSKILLVESVIGLNVSVITSQNLTRGNRHESTIITTDPKIFSTLKSQVQSLLKNKSVPFHDLYDAKVNYDFLKQQAHD